MELEQSSLMREVTAVINSGPKPVHYSWQADIIANKKTYRALRVISIDFIQNFEETYADEIFLSVAISGGYYAHRIFPFQDNLEIILSKVPLKEVGDVNDVENKVQTERYTAVLLNKENPVIEGNGMNTPDEKALDLTNIYTIEFQLINKALEKLRSISFGTKLRNTTTEDAIKAILTKESQSIGVEKDRLPIGVDMVKASNQIQRAHISIPDGTMLVDMPWYIHNKCGGIYSAGLGYYFYGDFWYLYPAYDVTRFNESTRTLTVVNIPPNKFPNIERTYNQKGNNLTILATGEVKFIDNTDSDQLTDGNGVRYARAEQFMGEFAAVSGNRAIADRATNNSEYVGEQRLNGNNHVKVSSRSINSNPFVESSQIARRLGAVLNFVWENSNPALVFPGMMVRVMYLQKGRINEIIGTVLKMHHFVQTKGPAMTDRRHITNSSIVIYVKPPKE